MEKWRPDNNHCDGGRRERSGVGPGHCQTCAVHCWCARIGDGLWGGPGHICIGGDQHPGTLGNGLWWHGGRGWRRRGWIGGGRPWHHL
jgi:hypothetical protein